MRWLPGHMVTQDFLFWVSLSGIAFGAVILRRNFDSPGDVTRGIAFGWFPYRFRGKVKLRLWFRPDIKKMNYNLFLRSAIYIYYVYTYMRMYVWEPFIPCTAYIYR